MTTSREHARSSSLLRENARLRQALTGLVSQVDGLIRDSGGLFNVEVESVSEVDCWVTVTSVRERVEWVQFLPGGSMPEWLDSLEEARNVLGQTEGNVHDREFL